MRVKTKFSIRKKLMLVLMLTSISVLLLSSIGFLLNDWYSLRSAAFERLRAQAGIVGNSTLSAMVFSDNLAANRTLSILDNEADIQAAGLFDKEGRLFAHYERTPGTLLDHIPDADSGDVNGFVYVVSPITFEGEDIGNILLIADLSVWQSSQTNNLITAGVVFALSLLVALLLSTRLQKLFSEPLLKLASTARRISQEQDYSLRAEKSSKDEIGRLVDDFNDMLEQIQSRDKELYLINEQLEEKVEHRTQELTELTKQLEHQVYHDALTGLANRITLDNNLRFVIEQKQRHDGQLAVLFLDLDRFKIINDTLGHAAGDELLKEVANRFKECVRKSDTLARLGGDEFAVLLFEMDHTNTALAVAKKLADAIAKPLHIMGHELSLSTSIGISIYPDDGEDAESLIKNADTAMYRSKDQGRNQVTFFSPEMNARTERRLALENRLREAIRENYLTVFYQPRLNAQTLEIDGVEALLRWFDPVEGEISPEEFIPVAEDCGLIAALDEWVLEKACRDLLQAYDGAEPDITLAVNFSPAHFIRTDIDEAIVSVLSKTKFPNHLLELEITESLFGPGNANVYNTFDKLKSRNIKIAVDDFGTAYSSLSRLKHLPLHTLKIDKSFIRDIGKDVDDEIITQTIISMAKSLNLCVVAEGVENKHQYEFVKEHECDSVQGFLFGEPMPIEELRQYLASRGKEDKALMQTE
jgi:diguanylate cyclase (GGDEF)-like protein